MNEKEIIKEAMKTCGWSQKVLMEKCGYARLSSVNSRLNREGSIRVDTLAKFLDAMGYEIVVQSKSPSTNKNKWVLKYEADEQGKETEG